MQHVRHSLLPFFAASALVATMCRPPPGAGVTTRPTLMGRAVLPAATFAPGPTSGMQVGPSPLNGQPFPLIDKQPVQGFSAVLDNGDGSFMAMVDNGFGALENSADHHLRVYRIWPDFKTSSAGRGAISVGGYFELRDPDRKVPFTITYHFTQERILTGADFDLESMQRAPDGTYWFGDEFGPFLLHTDASGKLLEPPIPVPDPERGGELRTPQNPFNEEASAVRVMNAVRAHARMHGARKTPAFSPAFQLLADGDAATTVANRAEPPPGSGLARAAVEIFDVQSLQRAGYPVITWTVNEPARMSALLGLGVNGIISDRPDLLRKAVQEFDANKDGKPGDLLDANGLIDSTRFDAQGHRGARDLRPENTLPAIEVALDELMVTLEMDTGITADGVPVLNHDPRISASKCRRADGAPYEAANEVLVKDYTVAQIQSTFICDELSRGPSQVNDPALSPVSTLYATQKGLPHIYVMPTLQQVFDLVKAYVDYYRSGPGKGHPEATRRALNAERVRFNIETKLNPRIPFASRTIGPEPFARAVAAVILGNGLASRADIQSFDFRTLLAVQQEFPQVRTVYLFGDFPIYADPTLAGSDEGINLQDEKGAAPPWLAGMHWPYRKTVLDHPLRVRASGGFEAMALSTDGARLYPMLEKPLADGTNTLHIYEFDLASRRFTNGTYTYTLDERGRSVADFILFEADHGIVIERDDTQGTLDGLKALYQVTLKEKGQPVEKKLLVDLLRIHDPDRLSGVGGPGDIGLGEEFAMPFVTIESVLMLGDGHIGVINDNNYPFSVGRHVGAKLPDDTEFVRIALPPRTLGTP